MRHRGETVTLRCGPMVHGGACLSRTDEGETVFVDGGIPGEVVDAELRYRRRRVWFAEVRAVHHPDAGRVSPPCPHVPDCGGCQLQHVTYERQLDLKRGIVADALRRAHVALPEALAVHGMDRPWGYRWRGEFHVVRPPAGGSGEAGLGFNRARSWTPVAVADCLIHHDTIRRALEPLRRVVREGATEKLNTLHLTVGEGGDELLIAARPEAAVAPEVVERVSRELPADLRWSTTSTGLRWRGYDFRIRSDSFIQVNWDHMEVLYSCVLDALGDVGGMRVVDAYAGVGVLSTVLAESAREVVCIEESPVAASLGVGNAQLNGVAGRLHYLREPVEEALPQVARDGIDALILDPPRAGCDSRVTAWLALAGPARVVYVSCDPATLARDLKILVGLGPYQLAGLDIVDMFPQTHHVECVAKLLRAPSGGIP